VLGKQDRHNYTKKRQKVNAFWRNFLWYIYTILAYIVCAKLIITQVIVVHN